MVDMNTQSSVSPLLSSHKRKFCDKTREKNGEKRAKLHLDTKASLNTISQVSKQQNTKKKKFSKKRKDKSTMSQAQTKNVAKLPQSETDYSSNWKKMLQQMEDEKKKTGNLSNRTKERKFQNSKQSATSNIQKENKNQPTSAVKKDLEPEIWFDNVDKCLIEPSENYPTSQTSNLSNKEKENASLNEDPLVKEKSFKGLTKAISMDCEMVGVGYKGNDSVLARVSIVNHFGHCVYDKYVKPREKVTDYRTAVSGIRPSDIENANNFKEVQKEVSDILTNRVLVGHAIRHDLKVLFLDHPKRMIRDTSTYKPFRSIFGGKTPSLKNLSARMLGVSVQQGEHSSVQDAQAAMRLYTMFKKDWEKDCSKRKSKKPSDIKANVVSSDKSEKANMPTKTNAIGASSASLEIQRNNQLVYEDSD